MGTRETLHSNSLLNLDKETVFAIKPTENDHTIIVGLGDFGLDVMQKLASLGWNQRMEDTWIAQHRSWFTKTGRTPFTLLTFGWENKTLRGPHYNLSWHGQKGLWKEFMERRHLPPQLGQICSVLSPSMLYASWLYHLEKGYLSDFLDSMFQAVSAPPLLHVVAQLDSPWPVLVPEIVKTFGYFLSKHNRLEGQSICNGQESRTDGYGEESARLWRPLRKLPLYMHLVLPDMSSQNVDTRLIKVREGLWYAMMQYLETYHKKNPFLLFCLASMPMGSTGYPTPEDLASSLFKEFLQNAKFAHNAIFHLEGVCHYTRLSGDGIPDEKDIADIFPKGLLQADLEAEAIRLKNICFPCKSGSFVFWYPLLYQGLLPWHFAKYSPQRLPPFLPDEMLALDSLKVLAQ